MSKTYCRFCKRSFSGVYLNCPLCGKWLPPTQGEDIEPESEHDEVEDE
jgi:hypothetical protein